MVRRCYLKSSLVTFLKKIHVNFTPGGLLETSRDTAYKAQRKLGDVGSFHYNDSHFTGAVPVQTAILRRSLSP